MEHEPATCTIAGIQRWSQSSRTCALYACVLTASADGPREMASTGILGQLPPLRRSSSKRKGEGLHDLPCRLRLDHDHLAEDLPLACLRGGLRACLDLDEPRDCEDAGLDNLLRNDFRKAIDDLCRHL